MPSSQLMPQTKHPTLLLSSLATSEQMVLKNEGNIKLNN
jgi:hypothetical protein